MLSNEVLVKNNVEANDKHDVEVNHSRVRLAGSYIFHSRHDIISLSYGNIKCISRQYELVQIAGEANFAHDKARYNAHKNSVITVVKEL
jgi:hypothetical protein